MAKLIQKIKTGERRILPLEKKQVTLGRSPDNHIQLKGGAISRYHAVIEHNADKHLLRDLSSKNGTYVNGVVIKEYTLKDQDIIRIGPHQFIYDTRKFDSVVVSNANPLAILQQVGKAVNQVMNEDDLMNLVIDLIFKLLHADRVLILLIDLNTGELVTSMVRGETAHQEKIIVSKTVIDMVLKQKLGLIVTDTATDPRFKDQHSIIASGINSIMAVPMLVRDKVIGIVQVDSCGGGKQFTKEELDLLCSFSDYLSIGIEQSRLNQQIKLETRLRTNLERFHSPEIVNMIVSDIKKKGYVGFAVEEKEATILFADICSFTPLSERLDPVEIAILLNEYFSMMTDIIFDHKGTLDKYIGDAVMALFGVPYTPEKHADRAVSAALEMRKGLKSFMERIAPSHQFEIKIGINTGKVVAGNIGSHKRMEYSVIGDTVNTASRLCDICEPGQVLLGSQTRDMVTDYFRIREVGGVRVKGKKKEIFVYELAQ